MPATFPSLTLTLSPVIRKLLMIAMPNQPWLHLPPPRPLLKPHCLHWPPHPPGGHICFHYVPQFLWVMATWDQAACRNLHVHMEVVHTGRCAKWACHVHHDKLITVPVNPIPTVPGTPAQASTPMAATLCLLHNSMITIPWPLSRTPWSNRPRQNIMPTRNLVSPNSVLTSNAWSSLRLNSSQVPCWITKAHLCITPVTQWRLLPVCLRLKVPIMSPATYATSFACNRAGIFPSLHRCLHPSTRGFLLWTHLGQPGPFTIFSCFGQLLHKTNVPSCPTTWSTMKLVEKAFFFCGDRGIWVWSGTEDREGNLLFLDKSDTGERLGVSTRYLFELILGGLQFGVWSKCSNSPPSSRFQRRKIQKKSLFFITCFVGVNILEAPP